jgi:hypothetical protein
MVRPRAVEPGDEKRVELGATHEPYQGVRRSAPLASVAAEARRRERQAQPFRQFKIDCVIDREIVRRCQWSSGGDAGENVMMDRSSGENPEALARRGYSPRR